MQFKRVDYFWGEIPSVIVCLSEIWYTSGLKLPRLEIFPALSEIQRWPYWISTFQRFLFHHNYKRWCYSSNSLVIDLASHLLDLNVDRCCTNQSGVVGLISKWLSRSRRWERYLRGVQPCHMAPCFSRVQRGTRGDAKILEASREAFWDLIMAFWEFFLNGFAVICKPCPKYTTYLGFQLSWWVMDHLKRPNGSQATNMASWTERMFWFGKV